MSAAVSRRVSGIEDYELLEIYFSSSYCLQNLTLAVFGAGAWFAVSEVPKVRSLAEEKKGNLIWNRLRKLEESEWKTVARDLRTFLGLMRIEYLTYERNVP